MRTKPLRGEVLTSSLLNGSPSFITSGHRRIKGKKGLGIRYERKVQRKLYSEHSGFMPGPWFEYTTSDAPGRRNYAQPDGILVDVSSGRIVICEIKYSHCADAYFQLVDKYLPIVRSFFNNSDLKWSFATVEIVNWYDCATAFPTSVTLRKRIEDVRPDELAVHVCRP